jgi:SAM-dependent methyltransferase
MMSRAAKAAFYAVAGPLMSLNGCMYRFIRSPSQGTVRVHLGPGQRNYIPGWINVDANMFTGRCDVWADLRNPLPFRSRSVDAVYSHHVIEHLPDIGHHLAEVFRCLKPGGVYRVAGPNGDSAIAKFAANDAAWFGDYPDKRRSMGGRLENFVFCRREHLTILTQSYLEELMEGIGYREIKVCKPVTETFHREHFARCLETESESDVQTPHTLVIEAVKPVVGS